MRKYFGTDGIRRIANTELSPELVYKVAKAGAYVLSKHTDHTPTILIGRDTRISGTLIESAMVAGFLSYGANVKLLGVIPTPAVAYLTRKLNADASVVISASHNTYEFNGIKYFSNKGMKIPDTLEEEIEEVMESGKLEELTDYNNDYQIFKWFPNCFAFGGDLGGNHFCYNFITNEYFAVDCCTGGLEYSYCKAVSLYKFIKNWDKQFEEENNYEI